MIGSRVFSITGEQQNFYCGILATVRSAERENVTIDQFIKDVNADIICCKLLVSWRALSVHGKLSENTGSY